MHPLCFEVPSPGGLRQATVLIFPDSRGWPSHSASVRLEAVRVTGKSSQPQETCSNPFASSLSTLEHVLFLSPNSQANFLSQGKFSFLLQSSFALVQKHLHITQGHPKDTLSRFRLLRCPHFIHYMSPQNTIFLCYILVLYQQQHFSLYSFGDISFAVAMDVGRAGRVYEFRSP